MDAESGIPPERREHSDGGRERQERQDAKPLSRLMMRCRDGTRAWQAWLLGCLADLASPSRRAFSPRFLGSRRNWPSCRFGAFVGSDEAMLGIVSKVPLRLGLKSSLDSGSNNSSGLSLKKPETYGLLRRQSRKQSRLGLVLSHPTGLSHNFCRDKDTKVTQPVDATMVRLISCLILPSSKLQSPQQRGCVGLETQAQQMTFQTPHNHASNSTPNPFVHTSPPTLPSHPQETYVRNLDMYVLKQTRAMPKLLHPPGDS
jgi:hypothetical protein